MADDREITLVDQIACIRREIAMRQRVYPKWVASGRMKESEADRELARMAAVLTTLLQLRDSAPRD